MNETRWQKVENIVDKALTLPEKKRSEYIDQECSEDPDLHSSVTELLKSIEDSEGYLEEPDLMQNDLLAAFSKDMAAHGDTSSMIGEKIGSYQITRLLGHGGMGSVFLAERADDHFEHKVALKLIRRGMDTPDNVARFQRERTILANLTHHNIGRMYDGGITADGLPYLIMEYIDGMPVDEYCTQNNCSLEERLDLFKAICKAVQYAHKNLVIHRDLKPANILVDQNGQVKILDFGIAKLLDQNKEGRELFVTRTNSQILTLPYAAPEQLNSAAVTTATDIYTLGILLCQLVGEIHPFDLENKTTPEIKEIIKNETPPKPSERATIFNSKLSGDLDAIIIKTLRKDPEARYSSAAELLEEVQRYQKGLPVAAHDDTFRYNASKFVKRHKKSIATAVFILFLVIGFGIFYTYQITEQRNEARVQANKARQVTELLIQLFEGSDPDRAQGDNLPVRTILEEGLQNVEQIKNQPEIKATMYSVLGNIYRKLGEPQKALPLLKKSNDLANGTFQSSSTTKADILANLALIKDELGKYTEAESLFVQADRLYTQSFGKISKARAVNLTNLAELYTEMSQFQKAEEIQLSALDILDTLPADTDESKAYSYNQLATIYKRQGKTKEVENYYKKSLNIQRTMHTEPHPAIATNLHNLGVLYYEMETFDSSRVYLEEALVQRRELFGDQHPLVASTLNGLGILTNVTGEYEDAGRYLTEGLDILQNHYGKDHMRVALNMMNLAMVLKNRTEYEQAISYLHEAAAIIKSQLGKENFYYAVVVNNLGKTHLEAGNKKLAGASYKEALKLLEKISPNHQRTGTVHFGLAKLMLDNSDYIPAETHLRKALDIFTPALDSTSPRIGRTRILLGKVLYHQDKIDAAEPHLTAGKSLLLHSSNSQKSLVNEANNLLREIRIN